MHYRKFKYLEGRLKDGLITINKFQEQAAALHLSVNPRRTQEQMVQDEKNMKRLELLLQEDFDDANDGLSEDDEEESESEESDQDPAEALEQSLANDRKPVPFCHICTSEIDQEQFFTMVPCGHSGCETCLRKWYNSNGTCFTCRDVVHHVMHVHKPDTMTREQMLLLKEKEEEVEARQARIARHEPLLRDLISSDEDDEPNLQQNNDDEGSSGTRSYVFFMLNITHAAYVT